MANNYYRFLTIIAYVAFSFIFVKAEKSCAEIVSANELEVTHLSPILLSDTIRPNYGKTMLFYEQNITVKLDFNVDLITIEVEFEDKIESMQSTWGEVTTYDNKIFVLRIANKYDFGYRIELNTRVTIPIFTQFKDGKPSKIKRIVLNRKQLCGTDEKVSGNRFWSPKLSTNGLDTSTEIPLYWTPFILPKYPPTGQSPRITNTEFLGPPPSSSEEKLDSAEQSTTKRTIQFLDTFEDDSIEAEEKSKEDSDEESDDEEDGEGNATSNSGTKPLPTGMDYTSLGLPQEHPSQSCGEASIDLLDATMGEVPMPIPWHAAIYYGVNDTDLQYKCGGTIISDLWIITVAHCMNVDSKYWFVYLGKYHLSLFNDAGLESFGVQKVIRHPDFGKFTELKHNVALLQLNRQIKFNAHVKPICLYQGSHSVSNYGIVVGFGVNQKNMVVDTLYSLKVSVADVSTCTWRLNRQKLKHSDAICVKSVQDLTSIRSHVLLFAGPHQPMPLSRLYQLQSAFPNVVHLRQQSFWHWRTINIHIENLMVCEKDFGSSLIYPIPNTNPTRWQLEGLLVQNFPRDGSPPNCKKPYPTLFIALTSADLTWINGTIQD